MNRQPLGDTQPRGCAFDGIQLAAGAGREEKVTSKESVTRTTALARPATPKSAGGSAAPKGPGPHPATSDRRRPPSPRARQIYLEASRLFVARGFDATSMSDIAEAVNITKAGLYHFVESKEDLLFTIVNLGIDELFEEVVLPARQIGDPMERLRLVIRNHLTNISRVGSSSGSPITMVANSTVGLGPEKLRMVEARKRVYFNLVRDSLRELQVRGDARPDLDPELATECILGAVLWTARWRRPRGRLSLEQIIQQVSEVLLLGVLKG